MQMDPVSQFSLCSGVFKAVLQVEKLTHLLAKVVQLFLEDTEAFTCLTGHVRYEYRWMEKL